MATIRDRLNEFMNQPAVPDDLGAEPPAMSGARTFSREAVEAYAAAARASYEKHKSLTAPGFQRDLLIATAKLAVGAARDFTNRRADRLALRLDAAEKAIAVRDQQLQRQSEHIARLQTAVSVLTRKAQSERR